MEDGEMDVRFNKRLSRVEVVFTPSIDINFKIGYEKVKLNKGLPVLLWESGKFNGPMLTKLLEEAGFRIELYTTTPESNYIIALAQPARYKPAV